MTAQTDLQTAWGLGVKILNEQKKFVLSNTPNFATMKAAAAAAIPAGVDQFNADPLAVLNAMQANQYRFRDFATSWAQSFLAQYAQLMGIPETDTATVLLKLYEWFVANSLSVKSRAFTFGAPSAGGSNVGNGVLTRLTKDRNAFNIESGAAEVRTLLCTADEHQGGSRYGETFQIRGANVPLSVFPIGRQGGLGEIRALNINSGGYLQNPGFEQWDATLGPVGWTMSGVVGNLASETTRYYRDVLPSATTPACLKFVAGTHYIGQTFSQRNMRFDPFVPIYAQMAVMRQASATGNVYLTIGGVTRTLDVSTLTNDEWNVVRWPLAAPASTAWFKSFNAENAEIRIGVTSLATGTILVDDVICAPYTPYDGTWLALVGGPANSATVTNPCLPFLRDDSFTYTDTCTDAILQQWLARAFPGFYLPHKADGTETWVEP